MTTWEYEVWTLDPWLNVAAINGSLNERGAEGWELVTVVPQKAGVAAVFKRETPSRPAGVFSVSAAVE